MVCPLSPSYSGVLPTPPSPLLPHLKGENILRVELDMPNRITRDYEYPSVAPSLKAALNRAMSDEEELTVDAR